MKYEIETNVQPRDFIVSLLNQMQYFFGWLGIHLGHLMVHISTQAAEMFQPMRHQDSSSRGHTVAGG